MSWALHPLTEEQTEVQKLAREFAHAEITPHAAEWDQKAYFEPSLVKKLGELGFLGMMLPEQYDGLGADTGTYLIALEEIAAADASVAVLMSVHNSLPTQMILRYGSDAQKDRFLRPMARGEILGAFALSEPEAGSDASALTAQAVKDGKSWIINGTKSWVTNGNTAGAIIAMARTDTSGARRGGRGIGAFIITPDLPGFNIGKKEDKLGLRASETASVIFEDCHIPDSNRLGAEGLGFIHSMQVLDGGRISIAALAVGIAQGAYESALRYSGERQQFGKPIREFQAIQFKLADMATQIDAARLLMYRAAWMKDQGKT
ncbi:MAG TPA: acyl-CoA dehydrogenase family protein, partial [Gemmatimonadaceae bacterium]|nr:acyl-CoA dehydrogenase family protein [Gemmatimonadaceae bacterium]